MATTHIQNMMTHLENTMTDRDRRVNRAVHDELLQLAARRAELHQRLQEEQR